MLIAAPDLLPAFKQRAAFTDGDVFGFADTDVLRALEAITARKPRLVALERLFAATPRGTALINRIKADPSLVQTEIRVLAHDSDYSRVLPRSTTPGGAPAPSARGADVEPEDVSELPKAGRSPGGPAVAAERPPSLPAATASAPPAAAAAVKAEPLAPAATLEPQPPRAGAARSPLLDQKGTRRVPRFVMADKVEVLIDGNPATLLDLSACGAQVVSPTILKPNQRVRMALPEDAGMLRFNATIVWAAFELPPGKGPQYRAGIDFVDADAALIDAFCGRHKNVKGG